MTEEKSDQAKAPQAAMRVGEGHSMREVMGPFMVDQAIRQAIQHCWMMLPEGERSAENVEKEILRLIQRALKDFKEDTAAFGFSETGGKGSQEERTA